MSFLVFDFANNKAQCSVLNHCAPYIIYMADCQVLLTVGIRAIGYLLEPEVALLFLDE